MAFDIAFNKCMTYEIGSFNPHDPDVINGDISTPIKKKKVGYTNIPADKGGETKYGIAKSGNPSVNIAGLTLLQAMEIYRTNYWEAGGCDKLPDKLGILHFDSCVNHGVGRGCMFIYRTLGISPEYKSLGPVVLSKCTDQLVPALCQIRRNFYQTIVKNNPSQNIFLKGWLRRINEMEEFCG